MSAFGSGGGTSRVSPEEGSVGEDRDRNDDEMDHDSEDPKQYIAFLEEAKQKESVLLAMQERTDCVKVGRGKDGLPILLLIPHLGLPRTLLPGESEKSILHNVMLLFFKTANDIVRSPFNLVYGHAPLSFTCQREVLFKSYSMLPRRFKKNIKNLYIVHPKIGIQIVLELSKLVVSGKASKKIHQIDSIAELQTHVSHKELPLPVGFLAKEETLFRNDNHHGDGSSSSACSVGVYDHKVISLVELVLAEETNVPHIISRAVHFMRETCNLEMEGIFRVPGNGTVVGLAMDRFSCIQDINTIVFGGDIPSVQSSPSKYAYLHVTDVYDAASIMNKFLGKLPTPAFPYRAFDAIFDMAIQTTGDLKKSTTFRMELMNIIKTHLPIQHIDVLEFLLSFLRELSAKSDMNKMTVQNLSIVFGPTVLIPKKQSDDIGGALKQTKVSQDVMNILLTYGLDLDVNDDEQRAHTIAYGGSNEVSSETQEEMIERLKGVMGENADMNVRFSTMPNRGARGMR